MSSQRSTTQSAAYVLALAGVPEHPRAVLLTADRWMLLTAAMRGTQPVIAELSFHSIHLWRGGDAISVSRIGGFLVVQFTDGYHQVMVVSLPGAAVDEHTRRRLTELLCSRPVRFMTDATRLALGEVLADAGLVALEERDNDDYVFRMEGLAGYVDLRGKRRAADRFAGEHRATVVLRTLDEAPAVEHLLHAYDRWESAKWPDPAAIPEAIVREHEGVRSWPTGRAARRLRVFCLEVDGEPAGVSVVEPMWNATWMGVVFKTDPGLRGATEFLRRHVATTGLRAVGACGLLNIQQDDGVPGLRAAKRSYKPLRLERKFAVVAGRPTPDTSWS